MSGPEIVKEPPWVSALVDQRMAAFRNATGGGALLNDKTKVVVVPLREMPEDADPAKWERTCDNCGTYCPPGDEDSFYSGMVQLPVKDLKFLFFYGTCPECRWKMEKPDE